MGTSITPAKRTYAHGGTSTQTEVSEFLDLRQVQLASAQQQQQIGVLRNELQGALMQAATAVEKSAANTAHERDEHYRSVVRHLERTHKQALEHERAAHAATLNNELTKQRLTIERRIRDELHEETKKREAKLAEQDSELRSLRHRIGRREDEVQSLTASLAREQASLETEREHNKELELELVKQAKEREAEKLEREKNGFFVEASALHECEAKVMDLESQLESCEEAKNSAKAYLAEEEKARHAAEDALRMTKEKLLAAESDLEEMVLEAGRTEIRTEETLKRLKEERDATIQKLKEEAEQKTDLCNMLVSRQATAIKKLAGENANLLKMLAGLPSLKQILNNAPPPGERPSFDPIKTPVCSFCGHDHSQAVSYTHLTLPTILLV